MDEHIEEVRQLSKDTRMLLAVLLDQYEIMSDGKVEVKDMCEAWDGAMQMYAEEAAERERKKAEEELKREIKRVTATVTATVTEGLGAQYRKLIALLISEKRYQDLERISVDKVYCQELLGTLSI